MTPLPSSRISWSSHTVARVAQAYSISPATLTSQRRDPLLVEARRVAIALLAERGLGPCWISKVVHRDHSTVLRHLAVLREGRSAQKQELLSAPRCSTKRVPQSGQQVPLKAHPVF